MAKMIAPCARALLAAALVAAAAVPARAQCRLCDTPTTAVNSNGSKDAIALSVETSLDFDRVILNGSGEGSAVVLPSGERSVSGSVEAVSGRAMVGTIQVRGEAGRALRVDLPASVELHTIAGASIRIEELVTDLPADPRLDSNGALTFQFGGKLTVDGDSDGDYRGDLPITVEYQ